MSLRIRLNILITTLLIILFLCSSFYSISHARKSIRSEVESSTQLALQLIQAASASLLSDSDEQRQVKFLRKLTELEMIRHIRIEIRSPTDVLIPAEDNILFLKSDAPRWFINLVKPPATEIRRWLYTPVTSPIDVLIKPDPLDEIHESWIETRNILIFLSIFIILVNVLIYIAIGLYLSPVEKILDGLSGIKKGNYKLKLPHFRLPELERISQQFNHMTQELLETRTRNQLLTKRSLEIQEEERRNLSQELHDELGQTITAIKAVAVSISNKTTLEKRYINSSVKTIVEYSDHVYQVAKNMMHRLRPSVLDEFGLVKALQNMIDEWNDNQNNIFCDFTFLDVPTDLSESLKINIYRIIQESLTNTLKHSNASQATVTIKKDRLDNTERINLKIEDNGIGIDQDKIIPGFGLLGMKERVEMNGGIFEFESSAGNGVKINIFVPIKN
jgi:two-component system sensor histidine kinase UhpB